MAVSSVSDGVIFVINRSKFSKSGLIKRDETSSLVFVQNPAVQDHWLQPGSLPFLIDPSPAHFYTRIFLSHSEFFFFSVKISKTCENSETSGTSENSATVITFLTTHLSLFVLICCSQIQILNDFYKHQLQIK